jgi:hypothetical protein
MILVLVICIILIIWFFYFVNSTRPTLCLVDCTTDNKPRRRKAIAFSSGGFRSIVNFTGVLTGVLNVRNNQPGNDLELKDFLNGYDLVHGVSGGLWFVHLITYSENFYNMIDKSARNEQSLFGICNNMSSSRYNIFGGCNDGKGETTCIDESPFMCCCSPGYIADGGECKKCNQVGYYTFDKYIENYSTNLKKLIRKTFKSSFDENVPDWKIDIPKQYLTSDAFYLYLLLTGNIPYRQVIEELVFKPTDDFNPNTIAGEQSNGIETTIACSAGILSTGVFESDSGESITYNVKNGQDVISWDIDIVYNTDPKTHGTGFKNPALSNITFSVDGSDVFTKTLPDINVFNMNVIDLSTWCGSAGAFIASDMFVDDAVSSIVGTDARDVLGDICDIFDIKCDPVAYITDTYQGFAPLLFLPSTSGEPPEIKDEQVEHSDESYNTNIPVRVVDGAISSDVNGIVNTIYRLQHTYEKPTPLKIVLFTSIRDGYGIGGPLLQLFGASGDDCTLDQKKKKDIDISEIGGGIFIEKTDLQVFKSGDCDTFTTIFNGGYKDERDMLPGGLYCDVFSVCNPKVKVFVWKDLVTKSIPKRGIEPGYMVDFFVVATILPPNVDRLSSLPGDGGDYKASSHRLAQISYHISRNISTDVYNVVFGDTEFCPCDFEDVRDKTTYY